MAMNPLGGIITGGLGLNPCRGMITMNLHVFCDLSIGFVPSVPLALQNSGGSKPMGPGEIQNFYKPINPKLYGQEQIPYVYANYPELDKQQVNVSIKVGSFEMGRTYIVRKKRATMIVNVINLVNATKDRMKVVISKLKNIATRGSVIIKNISAKIRRN